MGRRVRCERGHRRSRRGRATEITGVADPTNVDDGVQERRGQPPRDTATAPPESGRLGRKRPAPLTVTPACSRSGQARRTRTSRLADAVRFAPGELPVYLACAAVAIYGCVPETDQMPGVAAFLLAVFAIELAARRSAPPWVHTIVAAIVLWSGLYGASGRASAIVGAWFAFWPVVLVVTARLARPDLGLVPRLAIGGVGGIAAIVVARTGALEPTVGPALVAATVAAAVSAAVAAAVPAVSARR